MSKEESTSHNLTNENAPRYERDKITMARDALMQAYRKEADTEGSPVTEKLVQLNLEHSERVYQNALKIARGENLDETELGIAAMLHDIAKLNHKEKGGVDTFHHHEHGFEEVGSVLRELGFTDEAIERISNAIRRHSDIPFIREVLEKAKENIPTPESKFDLALRDADTLDQLGAGGVHKIVHLRQNPNDRFIKEDNGDIQKAIASAKKTFEDALGVISTKTGKKMAKELAEKTKPFFDKLAGITTLDEFDRVHEEFLASP